MIEQRRWFTATRPLLLALLAASLLLPGCKQAAEQLKGSQTGTTKSQVAGKLSDDFQTIAQTILPTVVSISTRGRKLVPEEMDDEMPNDEMHKGLPNEQQGVGSGVIVDAQKGYVLTNNHVVSGADQIQITLENGRHVGARVVGTDPPSDLAVLQIQHPNGLKAAVIGDSSALRVGEWVLAIGSPFGLDSTVTAGIISAKGRAEMGVADFEDFIQTDAAINPGNSGGPLVNTKGEMIGINTAIATRTTGYMGIGFAIPSNMIKQVMQELIDKGKVTRSQLGVYIGEIDQDLRQALKIDAQQTGILVMQVIPGTPAAEVGFKKYDVIVSLNGKPVYQVSPFRNQIALTLPGQQMEIGILRNGKPLTLKPKLREMSGEPQTAPDILKSRLGFRLDPISDSLRQQLNLPDSFNGLVVGTIEQSSNAYRRGLRQGDLVLEVNRQAVSSTEDVQKAIGSAKPGDAILLNIIRDGQTRILAFELAK